MTLLPISNSNLSAIVDRKDFSKCLKFQWKISKRGYVYKTTGGFALLHRFLLGLSLGDGKVVDHKNHNLLDNRKSELRICTQLQNKANLIKKKKASSKFKGVSWITQKRKWRVTLQLNYKCISLGCFYDEIHAAKVYDIWAKHYFGEFALTNF